MIQISYLSKASSPMSAAQLVSLLQQCHANNMARGVTGMLFYGNGTFLQVIEGEATTVDELVGKIARDPRHEDIRILSRKAIEHREHPDWSMGFEQVTAKGLRDVVAACAHVGCAPSGDKHGAGPVAVVLQVFFDQEICGFPA